MFDKFFKKHTVEDLLGILKDRTFKDSKADAMLKNVDINYKDDQNRSLLHLVVESNLTEAIKWLAGHKIDLNALDTNGDSSLMYAAKAGAVQSVRTLLQLGASPDIANNNGRIPIQEAVKKNYKDAYVLLRDKTKDLNHTDEDGLSLVYDAIESMNLDIVKDVLKKLKNQVDAKVFFYPPTYSDINILKFLASSLDLNTTDEQGRTPLFYLVRNGAMNTDSFTYILSMGADINQVDNDGNTVLMALIKEIVETEEQSEKATDEDPKIKGMIDMIPWLIEENLDYNKCNADGENPLMYATTHRHTKVVSKLLEFEVDPNYINEKGETPLAIAAMQGKANIDMVSLLLDYGARPNVANENGKTIIEKLLDTELFLRNDKKLKMKDRAEINENENYKSVLEEILLNGEVNLTMLNSEGNPFFFDCVEHRNFDLVKMLVKYGADINLKNKEGYNIIYYYMSKNMSFRRVIDQQNYLIMLRNIISLGANVNSRDDFGGITLHKAILDNDLQTIKVLLNAGADINAVDNKGRNMVHNCMWQNKVKIFRLLYSYNKKLINTPDKFGVLPVNYAAFLGYGELVLELIDSGSYVNNPYKKTHYIFNFLKKFHKNLKPLLENTRNPADHKKMKVLIENMVKEFNVPM